MASPRQDIAKLGTTWNATILWYARAMGAMWARPIDDRRGWRYLAAMHGIDLANNGWTAQGLFRPTVESLPNATEREQMWDQCQHAGWYFLPWHRGYVASFEAIVAQTIRDLGGPADWALPYWNYLDSSNANARGIPPAFCEPTLPDGSGNPLAMFARTPTLSLTTLLTGGSDIDLAAMKLTGFTGDPGASSLGGSPTGFVQFGPNGSAGALENNPHNFVHVMAGGLGGYLSDPNYAALDPLFWMHHCNIDRLWSAWLSQSSNVQENGSAWRNGPSPRGFVMPKPDGTLQVFSPAEALPGGRIDPVFDDLFAGTGVTPPGAAPAAVEGSLPENEMPAKLSDKAVLPPDLLGSNTGSLRIDSGQVSTQVAMSSAAVPASAEPRRFYALLENIKGAAPSGGLTISVGLPGQSSDQALRTRTAVLFGLSKASTNHGGNGLSMSVDITDQVATLSAITGEVPSALEVHIQQPGPLVIGTITVGKVSILSKTAE